MVLGVIQQTGIRVQGRLEQHHKSITFQLDTYEELLYLSCKYPD